MMRMNCERNPKSTLFSSNWIQRKHQTTGEITRIDLEGLKPR